MRLSPNNIAWIEKGWLGLSDEYMMLGPCQLNNEIHCAYIGSKPNTRQLFNIVFIFYEKLVCGFS